MNIPKEHIKLLRGNIESVMQGLNSLGNILILAEEAELTEQCGVNTSNSFNTPPPRPAFLERDIKNVSEGVLHPSDMKLGEDWTVYTLKFKCNQCAAEWSFLSEIPSDNSGCPRGACGGFVASYHSESHSLNTLKKEKQEFFEDFGDEDEDELAKMKDMAAKLDKASHLTDEDISKMCEQVAANVASGESHEDEEGPKLFRVECAIRNSFEVTAASKELAQEEVEGSSWCDLLEGGEPGGADFHYSVKAMESEEDEEEPREANPVEVLFDYISEAFTDEHSLTRPANDTKNWYPEGMDQLCAPSHLRNLMVRAQDFLDADTSLRERVKELKKELEGREISVAMLKELAKRYRDELDTMRKNKTD